MATITPGPISIAARAARARLGSPVSSRISASFSIRQSTSAIAATSDSRALSSQKFIESRAANSASEESRMLRWSSGSMFPRKRSSDCFEASESFGSKSAKTLSWVSSVWATFMSYS